MKERLLKLRAECKEREYCKGCKHELSDCVLYDGEENQFYPCDWTDGFIDWLSIDAEVVREVIVEILENGSKEEK